MNNHTGIRTVSLLVGVLLFMASIQTSFAAFNIKDWNWNTPFGNKTTENETWSNTTWSSTNDSTKNTTPENTTWSSTNGSAPSSDLINVNPFFGSTSFSIPPMKKLPKIQ